LRKGREGFQMSNLDGLNLIKDNLTELSNGKQNARRRRTPFSTTGRAFHSLDSIVDEDGTQSVGGPVDNPAFESDEVSVTQPSTMARSINEGVSGTDWDADETHREVEQGYKQHEQGEPEHQQLDPNATEPGNYADLAIEDSQVIVRTHAEPYMFIRSTDVSNSVPNEELPRETCSREEHIALTERKSSDSALNADTVSSIPVSTSRECDDQVQVEPVTQTDILPDSRPPPIAVRNPDIFVTSVEKTYDSINQRSVHRDSELESKLDKSGTRSPTSSASPTKRVTVEGHRPATAPRPPKKPPIPPGKPSKQLSVEQHRTEGETETASIVRKSIKSPDLPQRKRSGAKPESTEKPQTPREKTKPGKKKDPLQGSKPSSSRSDLV
uniref:Microtubule-associated protein futsch n=1 Tax=Echinostoma caproni TaxID=27848 RepID=A0A183BCJ6_9TREM